MPPPYLETPIGRLWPIVTGAGLLAIVRADDAGDAVAAASAHSTTDVVTVDAIVAALRAWFDGTTLELELDVALDLRAHTPFDRAIYDTARRVRYGETASYGELAIMAGRPGAARAAGGALARCRVAPVVPCHRIVAADGRIGGWGEDLGTKRWLLAHEANARRTWLAVASAGWRRATSSSRALRRRQQPDRPWAPRRLPPGSS